MNIEHFNKTIDNYIKSVDDWLKANSNQVDMGNVAEFTIYKEHIENKLEEMASNEDSPLHNISGKEMNYLSTKFADYVIGITDEKTKFLNKNLIEFSGDGVENFDYYIDEKMLENRVIKELKEIQKIKEFDTPVDNFSIKFTVNLGAGHSSEVDEVVVGDCIDSIREEIEKYIKEIIDQEELDTDLHEIMSTFEISCSDNDFEVESIEKDCFSPTSGHYTISDGYFTTQYLEFKIKCNDPSKNILKDTDYEQIKEFVLENCEQHFTTDMELKESSLSLERLDVDSNQIKEKNKLKR